MVNNTHLTNINANQSIILSSLNKSYSADDFNHGELTSITITNKIILSKSEENECMVMQGNQSNQIVILAALKNS